LDARIYYVWLSQNINPGTFPSNSLLELGISPAQIFKMDKDEILETVTARPDEAGRLCDKDLSEAEKIVEKCARLRMKILTLGDESYPERLKNIFAPPLVLFLWGELPKIDGEVVVGFVGSRRCSEYGVRVVERLSYDVASAGALVVSGMARGVDASAHRGALKAGKKTVGVLGCGLDVGYPFENRELMKKTIENGALLSEYPPGTLPLGKHFPVRNRIISGLSLGVAVSEAPKRSGALITANYAIDQGRDVFVVPSNIDSPLGEGSNNLLKQGAKLITCAGDILEEYENLYPDKIKNEPVYQKRVVLTYAKGREDAARGGKRQAAREDVPKEKPRDISSLSEEEKSVYRAVEKLGKVHADELSALLSLPVFKVGALLTTLEIKELIVQLPGRFFQIKQ